MRLLGLVGGRVDASPALPPQRAVSPGSSWELEVRLDPVWNEPRAHVIALALDRRAVHPLRSWGDLARVARAHGVADDDVIWDVDAQHWCFQNWGLPAACATNAG